MLYRMISANNVHWCLINCNQLQNKDRMDNSRLILWCCPSHEGDTHKTVPILTFTRVIKQVNNDLIHKISQTFFFGYCKYVLLYDITQQSSLFYHSPRDRHTPPEVLGPRIVCYPDTWLPPRSTSAPPSRSHSPHL